MNINLSFRMKVCSLNSHLTWSVAAVMITVSIEIKVLFSYIVIYFYSSYTRLVFIFIEYCCEKERSEMTFVVIVMMSQDQLGTNGTRKKQ